MKRQKRSVSLGGRKLRTSTGKDTKTVTRARGRSSQIISSVAFSRNVETFQHLIETSPFGHVILQDSKILSANLMFAKLMAFRSVENIRGKKFSGLLTPESQRTFNLMVRRLERGETPIQKFDLVLRRNNGTTIDVETTVIRCEVDGKQAFALHCSDITDRKNLQRRLIDSESLFRNVVNSMGDALVITDLQGKVLDVNREFERLTGYDRSDAVGKEIPYPWTDQISMRSVMDWLERLRKDGSLRDFDVTWVTKEGRKIAVSLNTTLLRSSSGDLAAMANVARDISERQAAQRELSNQVRRLEVLYELGRLLTGTLDSQEIARITYQQVWKVIPFDVFFLDLYDEERQELRPVIWYDRKGEDLVEYQVPERAVPLAESPACVRVVKSRKSFLELRGSQATSEYLRFGEVSALSKSLVFVPMFSKDRIIGIVSVQSYEYQSYTQEHVTLLESIASVAAIALEKAKLYNETVAKSLEIEARNKELDDFTYVVSHDLKEPLISVEGYTKILKKIYEDRLDGEGKQYLQSVIESCGHMKRLIEDLLQLSRVSKVQEHRTTIKLSELVTQVISEFEFAIRDRKVKIQSSDSLPSVLGIEAHLKIVFRNLISNAIKFCDKPNPLIDITATTEGRMAIIRVKDNGIGIEPQYFDKIFMIFQRLHKREEFEGTGAGLTMVKKIVESHGGRIWVDSTPGEGSTFSFTLPVP
ncbi:MAG TPA: PAS domain S-box protein [Bacteroidota bacterium]|nr:PAS domain S-box protein [Bacteroidota bacterium]